MKPSEWLQSNGWVRMHDREARLSDWRDPVTGKYYLFIEAIQIQDFRDAVKDEPLTLTDTPRPWSTDDMKKGDQ